MVSADLCPPILAQFRVKDKYKSYRKKAQHYAEEEKRLWEDFRHGMIIGTKEFVDRIRSKYTPHNFHKEIPQHRALGKSVRSLRDSNPAQRYSYQCQRMGKGKLGNRPYKP